CACSTRGISPTGGSCSSGARSAPTSRPRPSRSAQRRGRSMKRRWIPFDRSEGYRLGGFFGIVALLHALGWGLFAIYGDRIGPAYAGAGSLAYVFGLRHAFDADHISAVDDTTRYLMQRGKRPLGVGFFFSLGHSTVVLTL